PQVMPSTEGTQSYRARRPAVLLQDREKHNGGRLTALPDDEKADVLREGIEDYLGEVDARTWTPTTSPGRW
ncbi:hypothetical protein ACFQ7B_43210, partial [Streptomyces erythrochromogenes]|uniref:hypothetical protein n=1 Tax=Streptomyces erythrochromogenes TaxID=285574 RepID=UPI00367FD464